MKTADNKKTPKAHCKCGALAGEEVPCIYKLEVYGEEKLCNCCPACRRLCYEEI